MAIDRDLMASANENADVDRTAAGNGSMSNAPNVQEMMDRAYATLADAAAEVDKAVKQNPALALAGAAAVGAVVILAIRSRQRASEPSVRKIERQLRRQADAVTSAVKRELRASGASSAWDDMAKVLGSIDLRPYMQAYVEPVIQQASRVASEAKSQVSSKL